MGLIDLARRALGRGAGVARGPEPPLEPPPEAPVEPLPEREIGPPDFDQLAAAAVDKLWERNRYVELKYNFPGTARWTFDQAPMTLTLFDHDGRASNVFDVVEIGSYSHHFGTWQWAWANDSLTPELRARALPLKELHRITGNDVFIQEGRVAMPTALAWSLTALSVFHLSAEGSFAGRIGDGQLGVYLALMRNTFAARKRLGWA